MLIQICPEVYQLLIITSWIQFPFPSSTSFSSSFSMSLCNLFVFHCQKRFLCTILSSNFPSAWAKATYLVPLQVWHPLDVRPILSSDSHRLPQHQLICFPFWFEFPLYFLYLRISLSLFRTLLYIVIFHPVFVIRGGGGGGKIHINLSSSYSWKSRYSIYNKFPSYCCLLLAFKINTIYFDRENRHDRDSQALLVLFQEKL